MTKYGIVQVAGIGAAVGMALCMVMDTSSVLTLAFVLFVVCSFIFPFTKIVNVLDEGIDDF